MNLLQENMDEVTKKMLLGVIERKQKFERLKTIVNLLQFITFIGFSFFSIYLVLYIVYPNEWNIGWMIDDFLNRPIHVYILLILFSAYWGVLYYRKKCETAENEFHALRCEIIQKSADLWKEEQAWKERYKLFEIMKKEYDINLYFENK
jgi:uncharacterized membrane protein